jgi:hypothetical protein
MDWRCGSNSRVPALQVPSPENETPVPPKKEKDANIYGKTL